MGSARDHQDPDEGYGYVPKLIVAGRLTGTLDGRPVVIEAGESGLLVSFSALRTAWTARKMLPSVLPALRCLRDLNVPLRLRVAGLVSVELIPNPSVLAKFIAPGLSFRQHDDG